MRAWDELVERCALRRRDHIGPLSDRAYEELLLAVRADPASFVDDPAEQAFLEVARALDAYGASLGDDDLLDDDEYQAARARRLAVLGAACAHAASVDERCLDARLLEALAADLDPDPLIERLLRLEREFGSSRPADELPGDWGDVRDRPRLRLRAALSRTLLDGAHLALARDTAASVVAATPQDPLGARHTQALALARLEDEEGFDALDARFGRRGTTWTHLARVLLLYKLDRMPAARRALHGFDDLCEGGAYALLRPTYVETYLPDRPEVAPGSFEESMQATREAEPIVADVPDLVPWCQGQDWFVASAGSFAERNDLDW